MEYFTRSNIKAIVKIPIDPRISKVVDNGMIEMITGDWLDEIIEVIERI